MLGCCCVQVLPQAVMQYDHPSLTDEQRLEMTKEIMSHTLRRVLEKVQHVSTKMKWFNPQNLEYMTQVSNLSFKSPPELKS
eukprot:285367-Amphidinium_carterae.1